MLVSNRKRAAEELQISYKTLLYTPANGHGERGCAKENEKYS